MSQDSAPLLITPALRFQPARSKLLLNSGAWEQEESPARATVEEVAQEAQTLPTPGLI